MFFPLGTIACRKGIWDCVSGVQAGRERFFLSHVFFFFKAVARQKKVKRTSIEEMVVYKKKIAFGPDPLFLLHRGAWAVDPGLGRKMACFLGCASWPPVVALERPQVNAQTRAAGLNRPVVRCGSCTRGEKHNLKQKFKSYLQGFELQKTVLCIWLSSGSLRE